jgi:hydroxyacylglutathione hydrolase
MEIAPGVLVATSSYALTTSTVVVGSSGGCLLIDPAVTVADVAALAVSLGDLGMRPVVAWSTHPHWDHVLWSAELGDPPRYAAPAAVATAESERAGIIDGVEKSAPGYDLSLVGQLQALDASVIPWEGPTAQLIVHDGHAPGHGAVFLPDSGVLVAGDMCSDVEIPLLDTVAADPLGDYRTGMERLAALPGVRQVVPGHGHIGDTSEFRRRLALDAAYLDAITSGKPADDPRLAGCPDWMRDMHEDQVRYFQPLGCSADRCSNPRSRSGDRMGAR